jgi:hypothetical protein
MGQYLTDKYRLNFPAAQEQAQKTRAKRTKLENKWNNAQN